MASQADVKSHHLHLDTLALPTRTLRPSSSLSKLSASWRRKATAAATTTTTPPPPPLPSPRPPSSLPHPHSKSSLSPPRPAFFYDGKSAASASESSLLLSSSSPSSSSPSVSRGSLDSDFIKPPSTMPSMKRLLARRGSGEAVHDRERERQARNDYLEHPQTPERVRSPSPNNVNMAAAAAATAQKTTTNGSGTFRNIGRRLFSTNNNASSAAAPSYPTDRSHSYSSESTVNSSPPRTPPSPQNAFQYTGNLPQLPPLASLSSSAPSSDAFAISPKSKIPATTLIPPTPPLVIPPRRSEPENAWVLVEAEQQRQQQQQHRATTQRAAAPRPTAPTPTPLPATTLRSTPLASTTTDFFDDSSDILQAVLSLGNDDEGASLFRNDVPTTTRTPAAAPTAISNLSSSFSSTTSFGNSRRLMTEAQAAQIAEEQRKRRPKLTLRPGFSKRKSSLWAHDSDSDEYGRDDDDDEERSPREERKTARPPPLPLATSPTLPSSTSSLFPSSFSLGRKRSPSPSPTTPNFKDVIVTPPARDNTLSPPGLSTPAKRALYACTLLKVHPQLDSLLRPGSSTPSSPVEIRYPRSINTSTKLASAATNGGSQTGVAGAPLTLCSRNLSIALAQTQVMRKLRGRLPRHDEVEIGWFLRGYASELVSPEAIAKSLASRPQVSPEAQGLASSSSTPDRPGTPDSQQQPSGRVASATDGMATWASRPAFVERCVVTRGDDQAAFEIGEVVVNDGVRARRGKSAARPGSLVFSPRVRILAGWSPKPSPKLPQPALAAAASPTLPKRAAAKAPPPWIAPRSRGLRAAPVPPTANPHVAAAHDKLTASADVAPPGGLTPAQSIVLETRRRQSLSEVVPPTPDSVAVSLPESDEQAFETAESGTDDEDDVPIAALHQIRRRSTIASISFDATTLKPPSSPGGDAGEADRPRPLSPFEQERISRLEGELDRLRRRDREREQELLRVQAERRLEDNKRQLQAARERRLQNGTELKAVLQDPRYGAGDAMAAHRGSLRQSVSLADVGAVHAAHQQRLQQPQPQRWPGMGDPPMSIPSRAAPPPSPSMARVASPPPPSARAMACSSPPPRPGLEQAFSPHERAHSSNEIARLSRRQSTLMSPPSFGGFGSHQYPSAGPYSPHAMSQQQLHRQSSMVGSTSMVQLSGAHPHSHLLASPSDLHQPRRRSNAMLHGSPQLQQVQQPYQHQQQPAWHHHHHQLHSVPSFGQLHQPQPLVMLQHNDVPSSARSRGMM